MPATLNLLNPESDIWIHPGISLEEALTKTTHLGIGAHQDDLEFMAYEGISNCYGNPDAWFIGITITDGRGSSRQGPYAAYADDDMRLIRREEQRKAAAVGQYGAMIQLDYRSDEVKGDGRPSLVSDLSHILSQVRPHTVYLHQPADKHDTHVAVMIACIEALRRTAHHHTPHRVIGCEVWRSLDWLPDMDKVSMDFSQHPELFEKLTAIFDSQISGGKRYDLAVKGRCRANATFFDAQSPDQSEALSWGMDLTELVRDPDLSLSEFTAGKINELARDVEARLQRFL